MILYIWLSFQFRGWFALQHCFSYKSKKNVDFSVCSAFYLLEQSDDYLLTSQTENWKLFTFYFQTYSALQRKKSNTNWIYDYYFCRAFSVLMHIKAKRRLYLPPPLNVFSQALVHTLFSGHYYYRSSPFFWKQERTTGLVYAVNYIIPLFCLKTLPGRLNQVFMGAP